MDSDNSAQRQQIAVLGAGSWGTALACLLANNNHEVTLWSHSSEHIKQLKKTRKNQRYFPSIELPKSLKFSSDLTELCQNHRYFLLVIPSRSFRATLDKMQTCGLPENSYILWGTKGFDAEQQILLSDLIKQQITTSHYKSVISGPSFAKEVMLQFPTALTVAADTLEISEHIAQLFHNENTRVYSNDDLAGTQVGGAVKNVLAIACGISDGLGYGSNAKAALITRGLAEITRLGLDLGGRPETFQGLSGIGDLVLTCTDDKSRNRRFGLGIGQGKKIEDILNEIGQEVEGLVTSKEVFLLAHQRRIEMPICEQVYKVLYQGVSPKTAVQTLLRRSRAQE
ncbi:MAG: NAD(P)H-dependent glycerol-3-phosphate dehydrogenase [Arenicella sp.]